MWESIEKKGERFFFSPFFFVCLKAGEKELNQGGICYFTSFVLDGVKILGDVLSGILKTKNQSKHMNYILLSEIFNTWVVFGKCFESFWELIVAYEN